MKLIVTGSDQELVCQITKEITSIGREEGNDVVLEHKNISKSHCSIIRVREHVYIKDLNSKNGTFVNNQQILPNKLVKIGFDSKISLGNHLTLQLSED